MKDSRSIKFRLDPKAHLPTDATEAVRFILRNGPGLLKEFRGEQIGTVRIRARQRQQGTEKWRCFLKRAQGESGLPLLAHMLRGGGMGGGQERVQQLANGFPIVRSLPVPRAHPTKVCPDAVLPANSE